MLDQLFPQILILIFTSSIEIKCTLDAIEFIIQNQIYNSISHFHDRINEIIPTMAKLTITNSGTVDDFKLTEVYAEYRKFSFHLVEK